ncbi:NRDE protein-domain-containing protein [Hyaloraphidium curvatum]|nr:NRDE protein-domain-containing protein [Hyaloraphidium curvatum]
MCILFLALGSDADRFRMIIASNRDEYSDRPTKAADFWMANPPGFLHELDGRILAPMDLGFLVPDDQKDLHSFPHRFHGHGTWLGMTTSGRFAVLTNYREDPADTKPAAFSRGYLVRDFLLGGAHLVESAADHDGSGDANANGTGSHFMTPEQYSNWVFKRGEAYNGFSLIVGDLKSMRPVAEGSTHLYPDLWYVTNRDGVQPTRLDPRTLPSDVLTGDADDPRGFAVGLSNATLFNKDWPKVSVGRQKFVAAVGDFVTEQVSTDDLIARMFDLLSDTEKLPSPPACPWDPHMAPGLSSICISDGSWKTGYLTRTQTAILCDHDLAVTYVERDRNLEESVSDDESKERSIWKAERRFDFVIE